MNTRSCGGSILLVALLAQGLAQNTPNLRDTIIQLYNDNPPSQPPFFSFFVPALPDFESSSHFSPQSDEYAFEAPDNFGENIRYREIINDQAYKEVLENLKKSFSEEQEQWSSNTDFPIFWPSEFFCQPPARQMGKQCVCPQANKVHKNGKCGKQKELTSEVLDKLAKIDRRIDGKFNNKKNPTWGSANSPMGREGQARYSGSKSEMVAGENPRVISNKIGELNGQIPLNRNGFTAALTFWGQFIDHDLDLVLENPKEPVPIPIPKEDEFFKPGQEIKFFRSKHSKEPRIFQNDITAWIDGSQVYGSTDEVAQGLRLKKYGKLKSSSKGQLLPQNKGQFFAGDVRANENIFLTSYHTIFMKQHNRLCDYFLTINKKLTDEEVYQMARHYVIGLIQKITFEEFLPKLLGKKAYNKLIGEYKGYDSKINPEIVLEFASAGFRVGHPLLVSKHPLVSLQGRTLSKLRLKDAFFAPEVLKKNSIGDIFRGLSKTLLKQKNNQLVDDVRNFLINGMPGEKDKFLDLFSINIQRGRDHGLPTYNEARKAYGLKPLKYFQDLVKGGTVKKFKQVYRDIWEIDLWVGIISEESNDGGVLGELGSAIVGKTFQKVRDGDRFWYEEAYPKQIVEIIKETTFGEIIRRNTDGGIIIPDDIFSL